MEVGIATTAFLILFPVLVALILMFVRDDRARSYITVVGALVIACGSIFCAAQFLSPETHLFAVDDATATIIGYIALVIEVALCLYIIIKGIYYRKPLAIALAIIQLGLVFYLDLAVAEHVNVVNELYIDNFSIIMALIIGIVGSGIIVYGLGYMRVHEAHNDGPDRRSSFFSVMFAFLGAMFAIVFCNSLTWMLCAWEVTTVCSFALIGYTRTKEAIDNSFLQIVLNMIGGIAFTIALIWAGSFYGVMELDRFIESTLALAAAGMGFVTYAPLLLFALAAFTKAAQMRHGRAHANVGVAAFVDHGQGRRLPAHQDLSLPWLQHARFPRDDRRHRDLPVLRAGSHQPVQRQARAGVLDHLQPRPHRRLRRRR